MSIELKQLQSALFEWCGKNFLTGDLQKDKLSEALGIAEEAGEIAHFVLKDVQNIREGIDKQKVKEEIADGVSDFLIFAMNLCSLYDICIEDAISKTAEKVLKRDWNANRENGETNA